tara:strand:+ start:8362 stop:9198 length:837 start_codon:yes stop_codon:yes gene_type:complete
MTSTETPRENQEKAYRALAGWWAEMGIEADPLPRSRDLTPAQKAGREAPKPQKRAVPQATGAAAKAAGFGDAGGSEADARKAAGAAKTLDELKAAIEAFDGCPLKRTARNTVFARGNPECGLMIVGEAPGRDEDEQGQPFVGRAGQFLDTMFAAIGRNRETDVYITNVVNWRPPGNRNPTQDEIALCLPFVERHIALVKPKILVLAGGVSAQALLRASTGIMRLRGRWAEYRLKDDNFEPGDHVDAMPIFHPAFLLRRPQEKKNAWKDLLEIQAKIES